MQRRVVVTGIGVVSAIGIGLDNFWKALIKGTSGIKEIEGFDISGYRCRKAAEIKNLPVSGRWFDKLSRASQYTIIATEEALRTSKLDPLENKIGIVLGTSLGGMSSGERYCRGEDSLRLILQLPYYGPSWEVARHFGLTGPDITISIACASGTGAIALGLEIIREGRADVLICGGVDVLSPFVFSGFNILRATTDEPVRPFDRDRTGLALGEGAGILILEELSQAEERGVEILAEVLGYGLSSDAEHMTGPSRDGSGLASAIEMALRDSDVIKERIDFISAHGTGTFYNDRMETLAIKKVFGERAYRIPINSIKAMTGHCLAASGAIEVIMVIRAMKEGIIPPTINYRNPDPECDLDYIPNIPRKADINIALSTSSAFGGTNAAVILSKFKVQSSKLKVKSTERRPVITGIGVVSSIGIGKDEFCKGLSGKESGISEISFLRTEPQDKAFDPSYYQSQYAGEIKDFRPEEWLYNPPLPPFTKGGMGGLLDRLRRLDRVSALAMVSSYLAIKDSGFSLEEDRNGIILGTAYGSLLTNEEFYRDLLIHGPEGVSPFLFPYTIPSAATGELSIEFRMKGVNATLCSGWTSGLDAIGWGAHMVKKGYADAMLAGGVDAYGEILHKGLSRLKSISIEREMVPYKGNGFIPGEGAAFFTVENFSDAIAREANIYAEIIGYGFSYDQDFGKAITGSIRDAITESNITPEKIEALFLSANSTFIDRIEQKVTGSIFRDNPSLIYLKPLLGETFGAHGPLSAAAASLWNEKFSVVGILSLCYTKKSSFLILRRLTAK
jgi:3-oxoacyl-[acyl-carrier-protein] synthase II